MGTIAKAGASLPIAPEGTQIARCIWVIDLGHHQANYPGKKPTMVPKVLFCWELLGTDRMEDGRPFTLSRRFTLSLGEKSHLRPMLEAWRGKKFTREELEGFDVRNCVGKYCLVAVTHEADGDKRYANVATVAAVPKDMPKPEGVNETITYAIEEGTRPVLDNMPEWVQKILKECQEYKGIDTDDKAAAKKKPGSFDDMDDDIPF